MKEQTSAMYPLRRLIEIVGGVPEAAKQIACSPDMVNDGLKANRIATVVVLAAECIVRRQGPTETQRTILRVSIPEDRRGEFGIMTKPFNVSVIHFCEACLVVAAPWRNVGSVQEVAKHLGGEACRAEES